jgi:hypothetical protein
MSKFPTAAYSALIPEGAMDGYDCHQENVKFTCLSLARGEQNKKKIEEPSSNFAWMAAAHAFFSSAHGSRPHK